MNSKQAQIPEILQRAGGLKPGAAREASNLTGVAEATVHGVGTFFHLLADPDTKIRVCTGLSCRLQGADGVLAAAKAAGLPAAECSCLAACDMPPAVLRNRCVVPAVTLDDVSATSGDWTRLRPEISNEGDHWQGHIGPQIDDPDHLAINMLGAADFSASSYQRSLELGADEVCARLEKAGLQGRGGAGFPAFFKWNAVRNQKVQTRYLVLNGDEGEQGTFKDRELMMRRPDLVIEGLAIAARVIGATEIYLYLRGEFELPWRSMEDAIAAFGDHFGDLKFHLHAGQGAYICGEETALLEALEGKRGMPRLKPPFPTEQGLWGKPTLIHNVETIACVPSIVQRGGDWFRELGKTEAGTKLYNVSGHVLRPGTYELPLGVSLDELVEAAGGYVGQLKAFCPGGASSGFLPASESGQPLDFKGLGKIGSMLGSAGVVVLNDTVDMKWAVSQQLIFFENESCGQCAPCRIGTRYLREALDNFTSASPEGDRPDLANAAEVAWQMNEGSICGLGQAAPLPLTSAMKYFPEDFR